jgi:hypothetical protein
MKRVEYYHLAFAPGGMGRITFRLSGESTDRGIELTAVEFLAVAAVLTQKNISFLNGVFYSSDNGNS